MSYMHSGAELLRASLIAASVGALYSHQTSGSWPIFVSHLPNKPSQAICIYGTSGYMDGRLMAGKTIKHPGFQVRVRASGYREAWQKMNQTIDHLDTVRGEAIVLDGVSYIITAVTQTTDVIPLGQEPDGERRESLTMNGTITFN